MPPYAPTKLNKQKEVEKNKPNKIATKAIEKPKQVQPKQNLTQRVQKNIEEIDEIFQTKKKEKVKEEKVDDNQKLKSQKEKEEMAVSKKELEQDEDFADVRGLKQKSSFSLLFSFLFSFFFLLYL